MNNRKIVFINQAFGFITIDIVNEFAREFGKVAVIYGDLRVQDVPVDSRITLSKVIEKSRKSNISRFARWLIASIQIFVLLITKYRKYEIFYFSVPPFAYLSSLFIKRRFSLLMWDVYPDALKIVNIPEHHFLYRTWSKINRKLFTRAYRIYTIGDSLAIQLSQYVSSERIIVIPLWSGITNIQPVPKADNPFIKQYRLEGKFIVQYSGNFGPTYNIETILEVANRTRNEREIIYLIIGRGLKYEKVKRIIKEENLENCMLLEFQPDNMIRYSLSAADLSVVLIEDKVANVSIPSKVYNLMAVGSPILSISPGTSEINKLASKYKNGRNFENNDIAGIIEFILSMKNSPTMLEEFKKNSLIASKEFTSANANKFLVDYLS